MTATRTAAVLAATAAVAAGVLAPGAVAAPASGPGNLTSGPGCQVQCITQAAVTPTAADATLDVRTTVPATFVVTVTPAGAPLGEAAGPGGAAAPVAQVSVPGFAQQRTVQLPGLQPDTAYRIVVAARDAAGFTAIRVGEFRTRPVEVAVEPPAPAFDSGAGCTADCILSATATNSPTVVGRTRLDVRTAVPAEITLTVTPQSGADPKARTRVLRSAGAVTRFRPLVEGLQAGRRYTVIAEARDANGGLDRQVGTVRTASARAVITIARVKIVDDADRGRNHGEIAFDYSINGQRFSSGYTRRPSGAVFTPAGVTRTIPADGNPSITVAVYGEECDAVRYSNCVDEVGAVPPAGRPSGSGGDSGGGFDTAWVWSTWTLDQLRMPGSLPPWYGSGLTAPRGFEGYAVLQNTAHALRFRAGITVDLQVVS